MAEDFTRMWTAALAHCLGRFERSATSPAGATGGIGAFTPDSFPVFDEFCQNAYVVADSNHGYKMIGVGALVAKELLGERAGAARAVPVRPVPHRQTAPGQQLAVPLELTAAGADRRLTGDGPSDGRRPGSLRSRAAWPV